MRLSNAGEVISKFGRHGHESEKFVCLVVSADNHIFVSDLLLGGRVQKFTFSLLYEAVI